MSDQLTDQPQADAPEGTTTEPETTVDPTIDYCSQLPILGAGMSQAQAKTLLSYMEQNGLTEQQVMAEDRFSEIKAENSWRIVNILIQGWQEETRAKAQATMAGKAVTQGQLAGLELRAKFAEDHDMTILAQRLREKIQDIDLDQAKVSAAIDAANARFEAAGLSFDPATEAKAHSTQPTDTTTPPTTASTVMGAPGSVSKEPF